MAEWWPWIEKAGVLGLFAMMLIWLARSAVPAVITSVERTGQRFADSCEKMQARYLEDVKDMRSEHRAEIREDRERITDVLNKNTEAIHELEKAIRGGEKQEHT
jgi:hypothetical protein